MASLTGNLVAETYKALLKTIDNDILTASEKQITDGFGGGSNVFIDSNGFLRANKYKVTNGLATQFLKADGSLDANTYLTSINSSQIIAALGFTPVTNARTLTINGTTYDLSANRSWTVAGTAAIWGNITGTLSNQTDLQNALNAKFNNPAGTISQYIRGDGSLATFPTLPGGLPIGGTAGQILAKINSTDYNTEWIDNFATQTKNEVKLGQTLAKGAAVYVSSANGTNIIVSAASNTTEALSSKTFGLLETGGSTNAFVKCVTFGLLAGLDTSTATAGDPVWLGVNGALIFGLANKPYAPAHLVYIGVVTRVQSNNGEIFVNVQNGFELKEIHDVSAQSPTNNDGLFYESSTGLWKNKSIATILGYTPQAQLSGTGFVKASGTTISYDNSTYLTTTDATTTYQRLDKMVSNLLASATEYPNSNAVITALALKADAANPVFTGYMTISGAEPKLYFTDTDQNPDYFIGADAGYFRIFDQTAGATRFVINSDGNISAGVGKSITAGSFVKESGTAAQFLKADGSIDSSTYVTSASLANYLLITTAASTYQRLDKMVSNLLASDTEYPNSNAVLAKLALKADAANPVFTGDLSISGATPRLYFVDTDQNPDYTVFIDSGFFYIYDQTAGATRFSINSSGNISTGVGKSITAGSFVKDGGTASQYLMADGSVSTGPNLSGYLALTGGTMTGTPVFASVYGNGTGDWTNMTTPTYLVNPASGYWRINYLSNSPSVSGVYNFQTGKSVYWGEDTDTGVYNFRGRTVTISSNAIRPLLLEGTSNQYIYIKSSSGYEAMSQYYNPVAGDWYAGIRVTAGLGTLSSYHIYSGVYGNDVFILNTNGTAKFASVVTLNSILDFNGDNGITSLSDKLAIGVLGTSYAWIQSFGSRPLTINASGNNVLINTTTNAGYTLYVNGTGRFEGKLSATKSAKNAYALEIKGGIYGSPRFQLYDLAVDGNAYVGLGVDMSGGAYEFSNYFPRTNGSGRWSVGSWAGDFGTGQYVSGYNEKLFITESLSQFSTILRVNNLFRTAGTSNDIYYSAGTQAATFGSIIGDTSATPRRTAFFRSSDTSSGASVWWGRIDSNGTNIPNAALDSSDGALGFWVNSGGTGGGTWTNIFNMTTAGITMSVGSLVGNVSGTLNGRNTIIAYAGNNVRGGILVADPASGNISTQNPESYSGEVRLGAAWDRGGIYASGTLSLSTSSSQIDFVFGNSTKAFLRSDTGLVLGGFTGGSYNENLRLVDASNNYSVIAFGASGTSGAGRFNFLKNPSDNLEIRNGSSANIFLITQAGVTTFASYVNAAYYLETSDKRLKKLIENNPIIHEIEKLEAKLYEKGGKIELGYFAQDAELIMPYAVQKNHDGFLNLSYREIHTAKIARLEKRVAELEKQLNVA